MERIQEQFARTVKSIRQRHGLSQSDLAKKLLLSKQGVYFYEKSKRMMKLLEYVEFVQMFGESVIIDKNGITLLENEIDLKNNEEEKTSMKNEFEGLEEVEKRGDVIFYRDKKTHKEYQYVKRIGLIDKPMLNSLMEYQMVEQIGDILIKYNLNGHYGYSIWYENTCCESNFWSLKEVKDYLCKVALTVQKDKIVKMMMNNLENKLKEEGLSLSVLDYSSSGAFTSSMDIIFSDNGEFRCNHFIDIATPYALNFGESESDLFNDAIWECIDMTFDKLKFNSLANVFCEKSSYLGEELSFSLTSDGDDSYFIMLEKCGKKLIFKKIGFGVNPQNIDTIMEYIKWDYHLYKNSPTLEEFIYNRDEDVGGEDYKALILDVAAYKNFFGVDFLDNLLEEDDF